MAVAKVGGRDQPPSDRKDLLTHPPVKAASDGQGQFPVYTHVRLLPGGLPDIDRVQLHRAMRAYCGNSGYLSALQAGAPRFALDGSVAGFVTADEALHAAGLLDARRAKWRAKAKAAAAKAAAKPKPKPVAKPSLGAGLAALREAARRRAAREGGGR